MRVVYLTIGVISMGLGMLGIVLPGLPTVPLILLAAASFAKSSPRLHRWLVQTKVYQRYGADFVERGGMTRRMKIKVLAVSTSMMLLGFIFSPVLWARIVIAVALVIKFYIFFNKIPTLKEVA